MLNIGQCRQMWHDLRSCNTKRRSIFVLTVLVSSIILSIKLFLLQPGVGFRDKSVRVGWQGQSPYCLTGRARVNVQTTAFCTHIKRMFPLCRLATGFLLHEQIAAHHTCVITECSYCNRLADAIDRSTSLILSLAVS